MKPTAPASNQKEYKNRHPNVVPVNLNISREAADLLLRYTPSNPRGRGQFLSKLIVAFDREQGFRDFLAADGRRELERLCRLVRKDARREGSV